MSNPSRHGIRENFVYWLFDDDDVCLYVGMTRKPEQRWSQHRSANPKMVERVAYRRMAGPFYIETARQLEREEQDDLEPVYDERLRGKRVRARVLREGRADYLRRRQERIQVRS